MVGETPAMPVRHRAPVAAVPAPAPAPAPAPVPVTVRTVVAPAAPVAAAAGPRKLITQKDVSLDLMLARISSGDPKQRSGLRQ